MDISSLLVSRAVPTETARVKDDPKKVHEAAVQFEALLISQIMKSAKDASLGDESLGGDSPNSSLLDLGSQEFSQMLAEKGGFGLAKMIEQGLRKKSGDVSP